MTRESPVSVIIPVKDDELVFACVESVEAAGAAEIIVVDNGSGAEFSQELAGRLSGRVTLLRVEEPGVYAARNAGVEAARGGVVFFTDADCVVDAGWIGAGIRAIDEGADIVQGYSGATPGGRVSRWLQSRYEAHLRKLRPGDGTETDTRNMAVRREVFETLRFNERYRRVGDTEFGLLAEAGGFRVAYAPAMRVAHTHDEDLRVFAAKQICHGWGAQRLMQEHPEIEWHGGHLKLVARVSDRLSRMRWLRPSARLFAWKAITAAALLQRSPRWLPDRVAILSLTSIDKLAALSGHISYRPGEPEPSPSGLLGRQLPRD
jgi:glycosyltransferase involved in cell wall biosynthesis